MKPPELVHYKEYIRSKYWTARKREYFSIHPRRCRVCGHGDVELHHLVYGNYGSEPDQHLVALCRVHHEEIHARVPLRRNMSYHGQDAIREMRGERAMWLQGKDTARTLGENVCQREGMAKNSGVFFEWAVAPLWTLARTLQIRD